MRTALQSASAWPTLVATAPVGDINTALAERDLDATDTLGRTAALIAAKACRLDVLAVLLSAGADINKQDNTCLNPFLWGASSEISNSSACAPKPARISHS